MLRLSVYLPFYLFWAVASAGAGELHIVNLALAPYSYEEDGKMTGLVHDLGNALAEEAGLTPRNRPVRVVRAVEEIGLGRADMVLMLPTGAIEKVADNLGPIFPMETIVLGRSGSGCRSVEDLRGKTVASVRGARYDNRISPGNGIAIYSTTCYLHSLKLLQGNRVDAVVGPGLGLMYTIRENGLSRDRFGEPFVLNVNNVCVFLSRKAAPEMAGRLRAALARLKSTGAVQGILTLHDPQYR